MKVAIIHAVLDRCLPPIKSCNLPACCCAMPLSCSGARTIRTAFWIDNTRNVATWNFCLNFWTWSSLAFRRDVFQSNAQRKFETPNDDKDKQGSLASNDKIAGMVLCTIQTSTFEHPANGAKRAHQTCIMNERMQPTLKRSAEISLTTGRGLSPDYIIF